MALGLTPIQIIEKGSHPLLVKKEEWLRVELGDICKIQNGFAFSSKYFNHQEGLPLIRIRDIFQNVTENLYSGDYLEEFLVKRNDFLIGMDGDFKISKWPGELGLLNQRVCRIIVENTNINKEFVFLCIQPYLDAIHSETSAVTVKHLSSKTISEIPIPLPPLPEQRAIVKKIETLFSSLNAGVDDLKKAQEQLKIYRQAVLKKAFEGELIKLNRELNYNTIENVLKIVSGNTPNGLKDVSQNGDIPFYKVSDMNLLGNEVYLSKANLYLTSKEISKLKIKIFKSGTVVFPKRGGAILTNKKRILSKDSSFDLNLMGIIPNENYTSKFLFFYFLSIDLAKIMDGSAVPQINNKNINPLTIGDFSIEEQAQIVKEIEVRLSVCDAVEKQIQDSLSQAEALRQSILKKSFEGTLLTSEEIDACKLEPDYEPASVLLDKIKTEKKANKPTRKTTKKK